MAFLLAVSLPSLASAQDSLPKQLIFTPMELPPGDFGRSAPVSMSLRVFDLADGRRAELYRVGSWVSLRSRLHFSWRLGYGGIEQSDRIRYGGMPARLQWSWDMRKSRSFALASDMAVKLPFGDPSLHPLSAKAPSLELRLRTSPMRGDHWRLWTGWWMRRVSQPTDRLDARSSFPSGSGFDVQARAVADRFGVDLVWRHDVYGLPRAAWLSASLDYAIDDQIAVRIGGDFTAGQGAEKRLFDRAWTLAIEWRPAVLAGAGDEVPPRGEGRGERRGAERGQKRSQGR